MVNTQENSTRKTSRETLWKLNTALAKHSEPENINVAIEGTDEAICLPREVANLLREILAKTAAGQPIGVIPQSAELNTQQAADLLNVSRPHVIKQLDQGILDSHPTSKCRALSCTMDGKDPG